MLRNSSMLFVRQCLKSKFLDTLEGVLTSQRTSPVVRDRLLDVLAAAAYAGPRSSFFLLWSKVKPAGKPDEVSLQACMRLYSNIETCYRVYPSILMTPCSVPLHHGEVLRPIVLSLP